MSAASRRITERRLIRAHGGSFTGSLVAPAGTTPVATAADGADALGGSTLFNGDVLSNWYDQSAAANRVSYQTDPAGGTGTVLRFTADNTDVAPLTPTANPRAQLVTPPSVVTADQPFWESYGVYVPANFPVNDTYNGNWVNLGSPFYGRPFSGLPPLSLVMMNGQYEWRTNSYTTPSSAIIWHMPITTRKWMQVTWYVDPATDGYAELYIDNQPVSVSYNSQTSQGFNFAVLDPSDDQGPWLSQLSVYYSLNMAPALTLYFRHFTIATTQLASDRIQ